MNVLFAQREMRSLSWLALGVASYFASFFIVMAMVCRSGVQLSSTQLHVVLTIYRPAIKVLPTSVSSKGLEMCAGLSEIEAFFVLNAPL